MLPDRRLRASREPEVGAGTQVCRSEAAPRQPVSANQAAILDQRTAVINILTIDIEDWRQTSGRDPLDASGPRGAASRPGEEVLSGTRRLLRLLEGRGRRATAFVLGSLALEYPALVREIRAAGHEIAAHGHQHRPVYLLSPEEFRQDVLRVKDVLEDLTGEPVIGYRAPWFSITRRSSWAFEILAEAGFRYDASVLPVHPRFYRVPGWDGPGHAARFPEPIVCQGGSLLEVPATTLRMAGLTLPAAGGIYLGILPGLLFARAIRAANRRGQPGVLYLHPHDLNADAFPRSRPAERLLGPLLAAGRRRAESRIRRILRDFPFVPIRDWLSAAPGHASK